MPRYYFDIENTFRDVDNDGATGLPEGRADRSCRVHRRLSEEGSLADLGWSQTGD